MHPNDTTQEIPYGYCKCGCGQRTSKTTKTDPRNGNVKGEPVRFVVGHSRRKPVPHEKLNPSGLCQCGCGQPAPLATYTDTKNGWIKGEPHRFIMGHNRRKLPDRSPKNQDGLCMCGCEQPTRLALQTDRRSGRIKGQPIHFIAGHRAKLPRRKRERPLHPTIHSAAMRFWRKVDKRDPNDCWLWKPKNRVGMGYGTFSVGLKGYRAHRFSYELHNGPIPEGMWVLHKCDNPACVNPAHLWLGTPQDNVDDMIAKGRRVIGKRKT